MSVCEIGRPLQSSIKFSRRSSSLPAKSGASTLPAASRPLTFGNTISPPLCGVLRNALKPCVRLHHRRAQTSNLKTISSDADHLLQTQELRVANGFAALTCLNCGAQQRVVGSCVNVVQPIFSTVVMHLHGLSMIWRYANQVMHTLHHIVQRC